MTKHLHDPESPTPVVRDPLSTTGSWMAVKDAHEAKKAGKPLRRPYDKPLWWIFVMIAYKAAVQVTATILLGLIALGIALLAHSCGVAVPRIPGVTP